MTEQDLNKLAERVEQIGRLNPVYDSLGDCFAAARVIRAMAKMERLGAAAQKGWRITVGINFFVLETCDTSRSHNSAIEAIENCPEE